MEQTKILISLGIIAIALIVNFFLNGYLNRKLREVKGKLPFAGLLNIFVLLVTAAVLMSVWGIDASNLWVYITSLAGLVAIGFVAVWSILSNVVAGVYLLLSKQIKKGNDIVVLPENIKGKVMKISAMFIELEDSEGYSVYIPNNMIFQRFTKIK
ncbi:mechanosensitive ion channel family protein [Candidatus Woesearchaeota archaeon]|nr:mechanosensitive ion channel family protein [Candidatus Woesearchaeota archaeon]